jgi:hypothetical protein
VESHGLRLGGRLSVAAAEGPMVGVGVPGFVGIRRSLPGTLSIARAF